MNSEENKPQLEALRVRPDGDEAFRRALHLRLAEVGDPRPYGWGERLRDLLREHAFVAGGVSGLGLAAVALLAFRGLAPGPVASPELAAAPSAAHATPSMSEAAPTPAAVPAPRVDDELPVLTPPVVASVPTEMVAVVRFEFRSEVDVEDVTFHVALPDGLRFYSEGELLDERAFEWVAELPAGSTEVPIAVRGAEPGRYRVTATATVDGEEIVNEVILHAEESA